MRAFVFGLGIVIGLGLGSPTQARIVVAEPDAAGLDANLTSAFADVTLSVENHPDRIVRAVSGFSGFNARNIATTGSLVFGQDPAPSATVPQGWDESLGLLRISLSGATNYVQIDIIFDDDDVAQMLGFNANGQLVAAFESPSLRDTFITTSIYSESWDIAYVLVGGVDQEAVLLDNLQFAVPEPGTFIVVGAALCGFLPLRSRKRVS